MLHQRVLRSILGPISLVLCIALSAALLALQPLQGVEANHASPALGDYNCHWRADAIIISPHTLWSNACMVPPWPLERTYTQFETRIQYVEPWNPGGYIWHSLAMVSGDPCLDFVEVGVRTGWPGDTNATWFFDGWYTVSEGNYWLTPIQRTARDGALHWYEIIYTGGTSYDLYIDSIKRVTHATDGWGGCKAAAGLAMRGILTGVWTETYDLTPLSWHPTWGEYWWHDGFGRFWVDYPCGTPPTCLNGIYPNYNPNHWSDNHP